MQCPACEVEVNPEAVFCHKCGHRLVEEEAAAATFGDPDAPQAAASLGSSDSQSAGPQSPLAPASREDEPEQGLWSGSYSAKAMVGSWIGGIVLTVLLVLGGIFLTGVPFAWVIVIAAILLLWIFLVLLLIYRQWSVHYELTTQRFIHQQGILKRVTDRIEVIDMDDVTFEQGIIQRMLNVGTIKVTSSDRTHPELILLGIDDVKSVADRIDIEDLQPLDNPVGDAAFAGPSVRQGRWNQGWMVHA